MDVLSIGALLLLIMLLLLSGGVWIAMTLAIVGWIGQAFFTNTMPGKNLFSAFWESNASWELAALPLFIWMGEILFRTKLSEDMFEGLRPWLNRIPGRLMHTTILGCGVFGSVSGSSAATCATIAKVALPELIKRGYNDSRYFGYFDSTVYHYGCLCGRGRCLDYSHFSSRIFTRCFADAVVFWLYRMVEPTSPRPSTSCRSTYDIY
jgi:hypothetical protein